MTRSGVWSRLDLLGGPKRYPGLRFLRHFVAAVATIIADAAKEGVRVGAAHVVGLHLVFALSTFDSESSLSTLLSGLFWEREGCYKNGKQQRMIYPESELTRDSQR